MIYNDGDDEVNPSKDTHTRVAHLPKNKRMAAVIIIIITYCIWINRKSVSFWDKSFPFFLFWYFFYSTITPSTFLSIFIISHADWLWRFIQMLLDEKMIFKQILQQLNAVSQPGTLVKSGWVKKMRRWWDGEDEWWKWWWEWSWYH